MKITPVNTTLLALAAAAVVAGIVAVLGPGGWLACYGVALAVAAVSAGVTLPLLVAGSRGDVRQVGPRLMGVGMLRGVLILGLGVGGAFALDLPRATVMGFVLAFYVPLLAAEAWASVRAIERLKHTPPAEAASPPETAA